MYLGGIDYFDGVCMLGKSSAWVSIVCCAGDKERGFVGSRQWIGAIELGFVLETLLGVTAKVITVSKGADVDQRARELADHFDRQVRKAIVFTLPSKAYCGDSRILSSRMKS